MSKLLPHTDERGRQWLMAIPDDAPDTFLPFGIRLGPPDLAPMGLPPEVEVRLHNALFAQRILTAGDARARPQDVTAAVHAAWKIDAATIAQLYAEAESVTDA